MCGSRSEICSFFSVGYVPEITYEMYDIAVQVKPSAEMLAMEETSIAFHMAYVNPEYTNFQLGVRTFFTIVSLLVLCFYCTKLLCRIPAKLQS